jgi:hypothetical protein
VVGTDETAWVGSSLVPFGADEPIEVYEASGCKYTKMNLSSTSA